MKKKSKLRLLRKERQLYITTKVKDLKSLISSTREMERQLMTSTLSCILEPEEEEMVATSREAEGKVEGTEVISREEEETSEVEVTSEVGVTIVAEETTKEEEEERTEEMTRTFKRKKFIRRKKDTGPKRSIMPRNNILRTKRVTMATRRMKLITKW